MIDNENNLEIAKLKIAYEDTNTAIQDLNKAFKALGKSLEPLETSVKSLIEISKHFENEEVKDD